MPFPGGKIIGLGEGNYSREGINPPHTDDSGKWHWIPILIGGLFLIAIIIAITCLLKRRSNVFLHWRFTCDEHESAAENEELKPK